MLFTMPYGQKMEIRPSKELTIDEELDIRQDEEIEGLTWHIFVIRGDTRIELPWFTKNKLQANAIALGCQWGAYLHINYK